MYSSRRPLLGERAEEEVSDARSKDIGMERSCGKIGHVQAKFYISSLTAIPRPMQRISSELRSEVAQGPVSTRVGDRLGRPQGAVSICGFLPINNSIFPHVW